MEDIEEGLEIEPKHMIQAVKACNFYMPKPSEPEQSRHEDAELEEELKNLNTLSLVDFEPKTGTIYIANQGEISTLQNPYDLKSIDSVRSKLKHTVLNNSPIKAIKVASGSNSNYLCVWNSGTLHIYPIKPNGEIVPVSNSFDLDSDSNICNIFVTSFNSNELHIVLVDDMKVLYLLNLGTKKFTKRFDIQSATVVNSYIVALDANEPKILVIDPTNLEQAKFEHEIEIEEAKSIHYLGGTALFVFYDECFNLNVYDFGQNLTDDNLEAFNFSKITNFQETFCPSDAMIDDQSAFYWMSQIPSTNFIFMGCSFAESVEILLQNEEGVWQLAKSEVQSIRILAPSSSSGEICSFRGIIDYPFKLSPDEKDSCSYKFADEDLAIGFPRRMITLSHSGRVDIYEVYFRDILTNQKLVPTVEMAQSEELKDNLDELEFVQSAEENSELSLKESEDCDLPNPLDRRNIDQNIDSDKLKKKVDLNSDEENEQSQKDDSKNYSQSEDNDELTKIDDLLKAKPFNQTGTRVENKEESSKDKEDEIKPKTLFANFNNESKPAFLSSINDKPKNTSISAWNKKLDNGESSLFDNMKLGKDENKKSPFETPKKEGLFGSISSNPNTESIFNSKQDTSAKHEDVQSLKKVKLNEEDEVKENKFSKPSNPQSQFNQSFGIDSNTSMFQSKQNPFVSKTQPKPDPKIATKPESKPEGKSLLSTVKSELKAVSKEDDPVLKAAKEQEFLESIPDNFQRCYLKAQYELVNDINQAFSEFKEFDMNTQFTSDKAKAQIIDFKKQSTKLDTSYLMESNKIADLADKIAGFISTKDKIVNYWETAKDSENVSTDMSRHKLAGNDLFTQKIINPLISSTINRGDKLIQKAVDFITIIRQLKHNAQSLNKTVNKGHRLFGPNPNDPFLSD